MSETKTVQPPATTKPAAQVVLFNPNDAVSVKVRAITKAITESSLDYEKALPPGVPYDFWIASVQGAFIDNPDLLACTGASIMKSLRDSAYLGLPPNAALGMAAFVAYKGECKLMPMVQGMVGLARKTGEIRDIQARVVYEADYFDVQYGTEPKIVHTPVPREGPVSLQDIKAAYSIAWLTNGAVSFEVCWNADLVEAMSVAKTKGVWQAWPGEQARKTVFKRHSKWLPKQQQLARVIQLDNENFGATPIKDVPATVKAGGSRMDTLAAQLGAGSHEPQDQREPGEDAPADAEGGA